jgi:hypothetical protein
VNFDPPTFADLVRPTFWVSVVAAVFALVETDGLKSVKVGRYVKPFLL